MSEGWAARRRSIAVADMTMDEIEQIAASHMAPEHDHLNALLDHESDSRSMQLLDKQADLGGA